MPTNRLGRGTVNAGVNLLTEERAILGKIAMQKDMSTGAIIRHLLLEGLKQHHPEAGVIGTVARWTSAAVR